MPLHTFDHRRNMNLSPNYTLVLRKESFSVNRRVKMCEITNRELLPRRCRCMYSTVVWEYQWWFNHLTLIVWQRVEEQCGYSSFRIFSHNGAPHYVFSLILMRQCSTRLVEFRSTRESIEKHSELREIWSPTDVTNDENCTLAHMTIFRDTSIFKHKGGETISKVLLIFQEYISICV